jgi:uncharacterized protein YyaL (SSP411 family)
MPNRLAGATSPYLLQHQDNPIDWYPWCDEAFQRARLEDKPVLLSVGYSSCHWCHVMAHETFEDPAVGEMLDRYFVCVKVDREERPDVDEAYMTAVQLYAGRGGWPMTVFLTPARKPFFAGTYFPKRSRGQYPGFVEVCSQIIDSWRTKRREVERAANEFASALRQALTRLIGATRSSPASAPLDACLAALRGQFDQEHGGFGPAPKFPPHAALLYLLAYDASEGGESQAREMACRTLEAIALGGIHDHVGGGFHRYSTDERWHLPHFEKMLYDNAQLLSAYVAAAGADPVRRGLFERAARGIVEWVAREMTGPDGLFHSAIDADSEGEEGRFYVWTEGEIRAVLGSRAGAFIEAFGIEHGGNYLDEATRQPTGANVLYLRELDGGAFAADLAALREARERRARPMLDDKALAGWNGLMIAALAQAGEAAPAERCAEAWLALAGAPGGLPHQVRAGAPSGLAFLEDYAGLAWGLAQLDRATGRHGEAALRLAEEAIDRFGDADRGAFFATSAGHEALFGRTKPALDNAAPSPNGLLARAMVALGMLDEAKGVLVALSGWMDRAPSATATLHHALLEWLAATGAGLAPAAGKTAPGFAWSTAGGLPTFSTGSTAGSAGRTSPAAAQRRADPEPAQPAQPPKATARLVANDLTLGEDGVAKGEVIVTVPEGFHLNTHEPPARWLRRTELRAQPMPVEVDYPPGEADEYRGEVRLPFRLKGRGEFELRLTFQVCSDRECLEPGEIVLEGVVR